MVTGSLLAVNLGYSSRKLIGTYFCLVTLSDRPVTGVENKYRCSDHAVAAGDNSREIGFPGSIFLKLGPQERL
ncbi:MAG: hypothetical protein GXP26_16675 [Planctomycetes bacterium]|nr:hypothetical protein [Planctomycetota bacterium]